MNIKYMKLGIIVASLLITKHACSMYNAIFRVAQCISAMTPAALFENKYKKSNSALTRNDMPVEVRDWIIEQRKKDGITHSEEYCYTTCTEPGWFVFPGGMGAGIDDAHRLREALYEEKNNVATEESKKVIREVSAIIKHENCHEKNHDSELGTTIRRMSYVGVEGIFSLARYGINKLFNIGSPTKFLQTIRRSLIAGSGIVPKITAILLAETAYRRFCEKRADQYACEHSTMQECEALKDYFLIANQKRENAIKQMYSECDEKFKQENLLDTDIQKKVWELMKKGNQYTNELLSTHPPYEKRIAMIQSYIDKKQSEIDLDHNVEHKA